MKLGLMLAVLPALALAGCNKSADGTVSAPSASVAAVPAPAGKAWVDVVSRTPDGGFRMGNPDAPIKVIEYGSRTCPTCANFDRNGLPLFKAGPIAAGKVSYEFRDFPLHAYDLGPLLLGQCVDDAALFPMLDQMMLEQQRLLSPLSTLPEEVVAKVQAMEPLQAATFWVETLGYLEFVKQRGLPEAKARACLADKSAVERVAINLQAADTQYKISGTPTFIVNGKVAEGVLDWPGLEKVLKASGV
ncbi:MULTISPECIES: thioredoxin domain-containing protein [unclassified Sphingomonas]|uniref:thioredoxin domain-containing protein n=1 Tax=unclassified Sphingomonas TaxID=196159 RepID=UPI000BD3801F|nr:MAG: hypothetical protein B7Z43_08385 [Sphingomonas sp. 12-62-6]OYX37200.1 MAG: hypothetical protein B7Y98_12945 [Sphingomonas sp. 32-62-10]